jgi:hypothetical protein
MSVVVFCIIVSFLTWFIVVWWPQDVILTTWGWGIIHAWRVDDNKLFASTSQAWKHGEFLETSCIHLACIFLTCVYFSCGHAADAIHDSDGAIAGSGISVCPWSGCAFHVESLGAFNGFRISPIYFFRCLLC